jgi:hypothetical protein
MSVESNGTATQDVTLLDAVSFIPVKIKTGETVRDYHICESAGGQTFWTWFEALQAQYKLGDNVDPQVVESLQIQLIAQCIKDRDGKQVLPDIISSWGMKTRRKLFEMCSDVCGLNAQAAAKEGKDLGSAVTTGGGSASPQVSA